MRRIVYLPTPLIFIFNVVKERRCSCQDAFLKCDRQICLPNNYSKTRIPKYEYSDNPVEIVVTFSSIKIIEINDNKLTVTLQLAPTIYWIDPRIILLNVSEEENSIPVDVTWVEYFWFPDIYVYELKKLHKYKVLEGDADSAGM